MKWLRFEAKLRELCDLIPIEVIAYERPAGRHTHAVIHHSKMVAIIEAFCEDREIDYCAFSAGEIKKFATGKGNCSKDDMIKAAQEKLGYKGEDDNEADALWMLELLKRELYVK